MLRKLSHEETGKVLDAYIAAYDSETATGADHRVSARILKEHFPLDAASAMAVKEVLGKEYLLNMGWDLSEAEAKYGQGWLDR